MSFDALYDEIENMGLGLDDEFPFGKYKGEKISDVLEVDAGYLDWAEKKVDHFFLNDEAKAALAKADTRRVWCSGSTLTFGKHKGSTVASILQDDPGYLIWCEENMDHFLLDDEVRDRAQLGKNAQDKARETAKQHRSGAAFDNDDLPDFF